MKLRIPSYYQKFSCIADKCKDSCCIGWEIDIDEDTYSYYEGIEGELGKRLQKSMATDSDGTSHFTLQKNGWCPFLNEKKLCDICIALGEEALSEVCTEYPRFTVEYENVREKALCLSCEEVGRILFSETDKVEIVELEISDEMEFYEAYDSDECDDDQAMEDEFHQDDENNLEDHLEDEDDLDEENSARYAANLENARSVAIELLQDRTKPIRERIARYLDFGKEIQNQIAKESFIHENYSKEKLKELLKKEVSVTESFSYEAFLSRMIILEELEVLDSEWIKTKKNLQQFFQANNYQTTHVDFLRRSKEQEIWQEQLMVYFTFRYFMKAYYDFNVLTKIQFAVMSYLTIQDMSIVRLATRQREDATVDFTLEDQIDVARIYAKEVEHSEENMEMMAEEFEFEAVYQIENMKKEI